MIFRAAIALVVLPQLAYAFDPVLPDGARQVAHEERPRSVYELPTGPYKNGTLPSDRFIGMVELRSWRMTDKTGALTEIGAQLTSQLKAEGYKVVFQCETDSCGGFDFRFNTLVLLPPEMFVDLSHYRFLSARQETENGTKAVSLLLSKTSKAAILQTISVTPMEPLALTMTSEAPPLSAITTITKAPSVPADGLTAQRIGDALVEHGHLILKDLTFETGSASLADGTYQTLGALAGWLAEDSGRKVALVGHTDSQGALKGNVELSQSRASSVQAHLINTYKISQDQLEAHGIGYLAPIASNTTKEGRDSNRRVEVVLLSGS